MPDEPARMQASKYVGACTQIILLIDFKGGAKFNASTGGYSSDPAISAVTEYDALDELLQQYQSKLLVLEILPYIHLWIAT